MPTVEKNMDEIGADSLLEVAGKCGVTMTREQAVDMAREIRYDAAKAMSQLAAMIRNVNECRAMGVEPDVSS